ncbi:MAG: hypothetical protein JSV88_12445 [Candidatus Aminicenantes bacterium]|nr:MAG: hypothetical protein JSV88_12445 [Candidatus Aminicenantes bacterium]
MEEKVVSKNGFFVRLPEERWVHIVETHDDLAGHMDDVLDTVENPDFIIKGYKDALIALKKFKPGKFLAVVYKEIKKEDGFIITAYFSRKIKLNREVILWKSN